jgi:hypothetical protein
MKGFMKNLLKSPPNEGETWNVGAKGNYGCAETSGGKDRLRSDQGKYLNSIVYFEKKLPILVLK